MGIETAQVFSAQEQAILDGKKVTHGTATDRVIRMLDAIRSYGPPRVALERAVYFTESFKATEGQPLVLRWAKALKNIAEKMSVTIFDDELIVGRPNTWFGRYSLVYPELDGTIIKVGAEAFIAAKGAPDAVTVTDEDKKIIDEVLFPYWNGKDFTPNFIKALPPETRHVTWGSDPDNVGITQTFVIISTSTMRHSQNWVIDFGKMLTRGCKGMREEAQARIGSAGRPARPGLQEALLRSGRHRLRRLEPLCQALLRIGRRDGSQDDRCPAQEGTGGDRGRLRVGSGEPGAYLPGGDPGAVVHPAFLALRGDGRRTGQPGSHGPVFLSHVQEGHRRRADHAGRRAGAVPVPLAEHTAEHRVPDVTMPRPRAARDFPTTRR